MRPQIKSPGGQPGRDTWILEDLSRSGLTVEHFTMEPLESEDELRDRLGLAQIAGTQIINVGGYWLRYPNAPDYYRLKLREPIKTDSGTVKYLSPKGSVNHPYILPEVGEMLAKYTPDKPVFITEGEKKAAKATREGFPCVGLSGVWNWKDGENDFLPDLDKFIWKDRTIYIVFDSDVIVKHGVRHAELRLAVELTNRGAKVFSVRLPNESSGEKNGVDDFLVRHGVEEFKALVKSAKPTLELHVEKGTDANLLLKEAVRLQSEITRAQMLKALAGREGVKIDAVQAEYRKHLPAKEEAAEVTEDFTTEQLEAAQNLLHSPDIIDRMITFTRKLGFTGEEINQKLLYLAFTSRLMDSSISAIIKGQSASGKSHLVRTVLQLFPESDILNFSYVTSKALLHRQGDLSHKILFIQEHSGSEGAEYSVRTLLSEGEISIMLPVKNEATGNFESIEKRIPATGLVFIETTTRDRVHHENQTRLFDLYVDESEEQTRNILQMQADQVTAEDPEEEAEIKIWRAAQTIIKYRKVFIPYAHELAMVFPTDKTRARRDFPRLLSLIRSHALLYQFQRETDEWERLVATVADFEAVLPLAETILTQSIKEMTPNQEATLAAIKTNFPDREFSIKELSALLDSVQYRSLKRYIDGFIKEGLLQWNGQKGAASRYTFSAPESLCHNRGIFPPNLLETLKNNNDKNNDTSNVLIGSMHENNDNDDIIMTNKNVIINSNNSGDLTPKIRDYDNKDIGAKGAKSVFLGSKVVDSQLKEELPEVLK